MFIMSKEKDSLIKADFADHIFIGSDMRTIMVVVGQTNEERTLGTYMTALGAMAAIERLAEAMHSDSPVFYMPNDDEVEQALKDKAVEFSEKSASSENEARVAGDPLVGTEDPTELLFKRFYTGDLTLFEMTDEQWERVEPLLPRSRNRSKHSPRNKMNAALWVVRSGQSPQHIPMSYGTKGTMTTCYYAMKKTGVLEAVVRELLRDS